MVSDTFGFNAHFPGRLNVSDVLNTVFNPLLTNKDVFLGELIYNAADAVMILDCDDDYDALDMEQEPPIRVSLDKQRRILTVEDAGVGMTKEELIQCLGTVARSGTQEFLKDREERGCKPVPLFGRFGVGFYSAFRVSYKVRVVTKSISDRQYIWESEEGGPFTVSPDADMFHGELFRGTKVICFLKEDSLDFLNETIVDELLASHSQRIRTSIVRVTKRRFVPWFH